jgi:hypothetical protein
VQVGWKLAVVVVVDSPGPPWIEDKTSWSETGGRPVPILHRGLAARLWYPWDLYIRPTRCCLGAKGRVPVDAPWRGRAPLTSGEILC